MAGGRARLAGTGSVNSTGGRTGWEISLRRDALQRRPAAESGLAGPGRGRNVQGLLIEALKERDRFLFFRLPGPLSARLPAAPPVMPLVGQAPARRYGSG